jgi:hypothetical protein
LRRLARDGNELVPHVFPATSVTALAGCIANASNDLCALYTATQSQTLVMWNPINLAEVGGNCVATYH